MRILFVTFLTVVQAARAFPAAKGLLNGVTSPLGEKDWTIAEIAKITSSKGALPLEQKVVGHRNLRLLGSFFVAGTHTELIPLDKLPKDYATCLQETSNVLETVAKEPLYQRLLFGLRVHKLKVRLRTPIPSENLDLPGFEESDGLKFALEENDSGYTVELVGTYNPERKYACSPSEEKVRERLELWNNTPAVRTTVEANFSSLSKLIPTLEKIQSASVDLSDQLQMLR